GRVLRRVLRRVLVVPDRAVQGGDCLRIERRGPRGRVLGGRLVCRIRADGAPERAARLEGGARIGALRRLLRVRVLRGVLLRLGQLEPTELGPAASVRLLDVEIVLQRRRGEDVLAV